LETKEEKAMVTAQGVESVESLESVEIGSEAAPAAACRLCGTSLPTPVVDLGSQPLESWSLSPRTPEAEDVRLPLRLYLCGTCSLVQLSSTRDPQARSRDEAVPCSSNVDWLEHAREFTEWAVERIGLDHQSRVIEIASNDGYLLRNFVDRGIPCLGIESAATVAAVAVDRGIPTEVRSFDRQTAERLAGRGLLADLIVANNVLAQVADPSSFAAGLRMLLKRGGWITLEFPHLLRLLDGGQIDAFHHRHVSYLSLGAVIRLLRAHGLRVLDVEELPTHGGSLRVWASHQETERVPTKRVQALVDVEVDRQLHRPETYRDLQTVADRTRRELLDFLWGARMRGETVVTCGDPSAANTLLNFCDVGPDLIHYAVDPKRSEQRRLLPGTRIPVGSPEHLHVTEPDWVLILPRDLQDEVVRTYAFIREWGGRFVVPLPTLTIL
jgi:hypothetical protein